MRLASQQPISAYVDVRLTHDLLNDLFRLAERNHPDAHPLLREKIEREISRRFFAPSVFGPGAQGSRFRQVLANVFRMVTRRNIRDYDPLRSGPLPEIVPF